MDNLTKTLLTGAAISAIAAVPAIAGAPKYQPATAPIKFHGLQYQKTAASRMNPKGTTYTYNEGTYVYSYSYTFWYKNTYGLAACTWTSRTGTTSSSKCRTAPGQKIKFTKDSDAKIKKYTTVVSNASNPGYCKGGTLSYYGPDYEYKTKNAKHDNSFTMTNTIKSNKNKYELIVGYDINVL